MQYEVLSIALKHDLTEFINICSSPSLMSVIADVNLDISCWINTVVIQ